MKKYNTLHRRRVIKTRLTKEEYAELLDNGEPCVCVQSISYSLLCRWFIAAVLPLDGKLEAALSQKNGWQDSEGRTYIVYPVSEITEILDKGSTTIKSALNELDAARLLVRERRGFSTPNRLYVKVPLVGQVSDHMTAGKPTL